MSKGKYDWIGCRLDGAAPVNAWKWDKNEREVSKYSVLIWMLLGYFFINIVVFSLGIYFSWLVLSDWKQVLGMVVTIAFVFVFVMEVSYWAEYQEVERMNQKLKGQNE